MRYSTRKEVERNSSTLFKRGLHTLTSFQGTQYVKGEQITGKETGKYDLSQIFKVNINSEKSC